MSRTTITLTSRIVEYVRANPGCSRAQIIDGIAFEGPPLQITTMLGRLKRERVLRSEGPYPKLKRWHPVEWAKDPKYMAIASDILAELKDVNHEVRQEYLAMRLEELFSN